MGGDGCRLDAADLQERLKPGDETLGARIVFPRPANPHESGNAEWHIADRDLAAKNGRGFHRRRGDHAHPALTDILDAALHGLDLRKFRGAELWQLPDHHLKAMREPILATPLGMADTFHQLP